MRIYYCQLSFTITHKRVAGSLEELLETPQMPVAYLPAGTMQFLTKEWIHHPSLHRRPVMQVFNDEGLSPQWKRVGFVASLAVESDKVPGTFDVWHIRKDGRLHCSHGSVTWSMKVDYHLVEEKEDNVVVFHAPLTL